MAEREWARMKANNSQECRNCHNFNDMDYSQQKTVAQQMHALAQEQKQNLYRLSQRDCTSSSRYVKSTTNFYSC